MTRWIAPLPQQQATQRFMWILIASTLLLLALALFSCGGCTPFKFSSRDKPAPSAEVLQRGVFTSLSRSLVEVRTLEGSAGSAFAVGSMDVKGRKRTLYLTAAHVFDHQPSKELSPKDVVMLVKFGDGDAMEKHPGLLLASDVDEDLALVGQVDEGSCPAVQLAAKEPEDFEQLVTLSNPGLAYGSAATAILSAKDRGGDYLLTTPCWHGSSGGLVANLRGEAVGMLIAMSVDNTDEKNEVVLVNYCYARPLPKLLTFLKKEHVR